MNTPRAIKGLVFVLFVFLACPFWLAARLERYLLRSEWVFGSCAQILALIPTPIGVMLRGAFYFMSLNRCSWETHVDFGSLFVKRASIVGSRVSTGVYCVFGHVRFDDDIMIGSRVSVPSGRRQHLDEAGGMSNAGAFDVVHIGRGTWVGESAVILADVGRGCIVGAGSVVVRAVPDGAVVGGNPAQPLRRNVSLYEKDSG